MKRPSYKEAVEKKCRECIYDPHQPGTWRQQVAACPCVNCPLYPVRPLPQNWKPAKAGEGDAPSASQDARK